MIITYTSTEVDSNTCLLSKAYGEAAKRVARQRLYSSNCGDFQCLLLEYFLYLWTISNWEQNDNGTTTGFTNYLTQEEFTQIMQKTGTLK